MSDKWKCIWRNNKFFRCCQLRFKYSINLNKKVVKQCKLYRPSIHCSCFYQKAILNKTFVHKIMSSIVAEYIYATLLINHTQQIKY